MGSRVGDALFLFAALIAVAAFALIIVITNGALPRASPSPSPSAVESFSPLPSIAITAGPVATPPGPPATPPPPPSLTPAPPPVVTPTPRPPAPTPPPTPLPTR